MRPIVRVSRVLVGVAFDETSTSALKMADVLASAWNADLTVLHAATLDVPAYFTAAQIERLEAPERLQNADRIVLSMPASTDTHEPLASIVEVLKECRHPVLFVPLSEGIFERSSS